MMIRNNNGILYISVILLVILLSIYNTCNHNKGQNSGVKTKTDTIFKIIEKTAHFNDTIIKLRYKDRLVPYQIIQNELQNKIDTNDYNYTYDTIANNKFGESKISIKGFGYISKIDVENTYKDTTMIITKEITKYKASSGLYLSSEYQTPFNKDNGLKPSYNVKLDYVHNKWIIGTGIGVQDDKPNYSIKVGLKIN
jgi:hypothetical protein